MPHSETEAEQYALQQEVDRSGPGLAKSAFIVIKSGYAVYKTLTAA